MNGIKKSLSILLAVIFLVSSISLPVFAEEADNNGVEQIEAVEDIEVVEDIEEIAAADEMELQEAEDDDVSTMSLLPLEEVRAVLDLTDFVPAELKSIPVRMVLEKLVYEENGEPVIFDENVTTTVWSSANTDYGVNPDAWQVLGMDDNITIDHTLGDEFQLIIGSGDQLDPNNIRYIVRMIYPFASELFKAEVAVNDADGQRIQPERNLYIDSMYIENEETGAEEYVPVFVMSADSFYGSEASFYWGLSYIAPDERAGLDVKLYKGRFASVEDADAAVKKNPDLDVTDLLWNQDLMQPEAGLAIPVGKTQVFTAVFYRGDVATGTEMFAMLTESDRYSFMNIFNAKLSLANAEGALLDVNGDGYDNEFMSNGEALPRHTVTVDSVYGKEANILWNIALANNNELPENVSVRIFDGEFDSAESALEKADAEITSVIMGDEAEGFAIPCDTNKIVTIVFTLGDTVVGSKKQVLRTSSKSYSSISEWFEPAIYFADAEGNAEIVDSIGGNDTYTVVVDKENDIRVSYPRHTVKVDSYYGNEANFLWKLNFSDNEKISEDLSVRIFDGEFDSADSALAAADREITTLIWNDDADGFAVPCETNKIITIVFYMGGVVVGSEKQILRTTSLAYGGLGEWLDAGVYFACSDGTLEPVGEYCDDSEYSVVVNKDKNERVYYPRRTATVAPFYGNEASFLWKLSLNYDKDIPEDLSIRVFEGEFSSVDSALKAAQSNAKIEITDQIWDPYEEKEDGGFAISCGENKVLTIVFVKGGVPVGSVKQALMATPEYYSGLGGYFDIEIYTEGDISGREYLGRGYDTRLTVGEGSNRVSYPMRRITTAPYYGKETNLYWGLDFAYDGFDVKVYNGKYSGANEAIKAAGKNVALDVTELIMSEDMTAEGAGLAVPCGEYKYLTFVFMKGDVAVGSIVQVLYAVNISAWMEGLFNFELYDQNGSERSPIEVLDVYYEQTVEYEYNDKEIIENRPTYYLNVASTVKPDKAYYVGLNINSEYDEQTENFSISVYNGAFGSAEEAIKAAEKNRSIDITDAITGDMTAKDAGFKNKFTRTIRKGKLSMAPQITVVFKDGETVLGTTTFEIVLSPNWKNVEVDNKIYSQDEEGNKVRSGYIKSSSYDKNEVRNITYLLDYGSSDKDEYYIRMEYFDGDTGEYDSSKVQKAVVGNYATLEKAAKSEDIKDQLFADDDTFNTADGGYKNKFNGRGVDITVFDAAGDPWHYNIKAEVNKNPPAQPEPEKEEPKKLPLTGSSDRYFRIESVWNGDKELDSYFIPFDQDTYYYNGYQTLLVNDEDADMTDVIPEATLGYGAKVYVDSKEEDTGYTYGDSEHVSKLKSRDFTSKSSDSSREPDHSFKYTVASENHRYQKNYWITVVKKTAEAQLYVNGPDEREILLDNAYDNHHDIFIANLGSEPLTNIKVELTGTNVKLDDYWTIGENGVNQLKGFTTTDKTTEYGELVNVGKIRLIPSGEGEIEGTLTITADGQEPRKITITGRAGNPKIDANELPKAVKYVPYSSIITTDNMYDQVSITFSLANDSGKLPEGVELLPNGELYGAPLETGRFKFKVRASYYASGYNFRNFESSEAEFTLEVIDNSDSNVDAQTDEGYEIKARVSDMSSYRDQVFEIEGALVEFMDFWLDGQRLERDVDYTAEEGSTKITIKSQTFKKAGDGKHTIAGEFRKDGDVTQTMTKAAQNYTKKSGSNGNNSNSNSANRSNNVDRTVTTRYTVTLATNGGDPLMNLTVDKNAAIGNVPQPTRSGYIFYGWYMDKALTQPFDPDIVATKDLTLYARWEETIKVHTIKFETNGGSAVRNMLVESGRPIGDLPVPEREGYVFDGWYSDQALTQAVNASSVAYSDFTAYAKWTEEKQPASINGFRDVSEVDWFYPYIEWAYNNQLMIGVSDTEFAPNNFVTGGIVVAVMARLANVDTSAYENLSYDEVYENEWYTPYAKWAKAEGLVDGIPFNPPAEISREDMSVILVRFLDYVGAEYKIDDDVIHFADEELISEGTADALQTLFKLGIFKGVGNNTIDPLSFTTRAQLAALMYRVIEYIG